MKYQITVKVLSDSSNDYRDYDTETVYEQILKDLNVADLAVFLNKTDCSPAFTKTINADEIKKINESIALANIVKEIKK